MPIYNANEKFMKKSPCVINRVDQADSTPVHIGHVAEESLGIKMIKYSLRDDVGWLFERVVRPDTHNRAKITDIVATKDTRLILVRRVGEDQIKQCDLIGGFRVEPGGVGDYLVEI